MNNLKENQFRIRNFTEFILTPMYRHSNWMRLNRKFLIAGRLIEGFELIVNLSDGRLSIYISVERIILKLKSLGN